MPRVTVLNELAVRAAANRPERIKSNVERWRNAVDKGLDGSEAVKRAVGATRLPRRLKRALISLIKPQNAA